MILILSIIGTILSLGGNIFIAKKNRMGWLIWLIGNVVWIAVNFLGNPNIPMVLMYVVYMVINIVGFMKWKED
ncbi:MAG: Nicotinamide mononucleotide transporter [Bacteroidetes bacterium ADurb.Bin302]|nr:MAG: Nicotinamide mononucleotide transporter [Bacteroidetes bacterium ADurb.Bin302]